MRLRIRHITGFLLPLLALASVVSCGKPEAPAAPPPAQMATIEIETLGITTNTSADPDFAISSLRVMIFRANSPHEYLRANDIVEPDDQNRFVIEIDPNIYDFVFIANETSDTDARPDALGQTLSQILNGYSGTIAGMSGLYFNSSAFSSDKPIPMTRVIRNVTITKNSEVYIGADSEPQPEVWPVEVFRAGIRIDLFMKTSHLSMRNGFTRFEVSNVPRKVWLLEQDTNGLPLYNVASAGDFESTSPVAGYREYTYKEGDIYDDKDPDWEGDVDYTLTASDDDIEFKLVGNDWYWYKRLILPSTLFPATGDSGLGIKFEVTANDRQYWLTVSDKSNGETGHNYTVKRNSRYKLTGNLTPDYIGFTVGVADWGANTKIEIPLEL